MKILVTGASGEIGKKLIKKMSLLNKDIVVLARKNEKNFEGDKIETVFGDLLDIPSLDRAVRNVDLIIHLAAITHTNDQGLYFEINHQGTKNLVAAAEKNNVKKFIFISSRAARPEGGAYAYSKYLAEQEVIGSRMNWMVFRPAEVYGASGKDAIAQLVRIIKSYFFIPIIGNGGYSLAPVYIDDVVNAIVVAAENENLNKKIYTLAGPQEYAYNELVRIIELAIGVKRIKVHIPVFLFRFAVWLNSKMNFGNFVNDQIPRLLCEKSADIMLAKKDLNFNPISFEEGINNLINNF